MPKPYFQVNQSNNNSSNIGDGTIYAALLCKIANVMKIPDTTEKLKAICEIKNDLMLAKSHCNC
jgi:hypothetical protein